MRFRRNLTFDSGQNFAYDVTGQQTSASYSGYSLSQSYDGDGLRVKKTENGVTTYYLRSTLLRGQVVAEMNSSGRWTRGHGSESCNQAVSTLHEINRVTFVEEVNLNTQR